MMISNSLVPQWSMLRLLSQITKWLSCLLLKIFFFKNGKTCDVGDSEINIYNFIDPS